MKKIENFMSNPHLFKVYLASVLFMSIFVFILFQYLGPYITNEKNVDISVNIKISLSLSIIFSIMTVLSTSMMRKSIKFWNYSKIVKELIDKANSKNELKSLHKNEFHDLKSLAHGQIQHDECRRIYAILETKYKYMTE